MKSLIRYGLAGLIFFTAGTALDPGLGAQEQLSADQAGLRIRPATPSSDVAVSPLSADSMIPIPKKIRKTPYDFPPLQRDGTSWEPKTVRPGTDAAAAN